MLKIFTFINLNMLFLHNTPIFVQYVTCGRCVISYALIYINKSAKYETLVSVL